MKYRMLSAALVTVPLISGCAALSNLTDLFGQGLLTGSGIPVTREFDLSGFDQVEASGGSHVRYLGNPTLGSIDSSGGSTIEAW
jgi:hypothetical protein